MMKILLYLKRYKVVIIWVGLLGLFGYSLWKIQAISNPQPDPDYLKRQQQDQPTKIEIKDSLRQQLENLEATPVDTRPDNVGNADPFNP